MTENEQIQEMARVMEQTCDNTTAAECKSYVEGEEIVIGCEKCRAIHLYNAGYRKASEVAREIFEEIETCMRDFEDDDDGYLLKKCEFEFFMREIKKRYTEVTTNDGE